MAEKMLDLCWCFYYDFILNMTWTCGCGMSVMTLFWTCLGAGMLNLWWNKRRHVWAVDGCVHALSVISKTWIWLYSGWLGPWWLNHEHPWMLQDLICDHLHANMSGWWMTVSMLSRWSVKRKHAWVVDGWVSSFITTLHLSLDHGGHWGATDHNQFVP